MLSFTLILFMKQDLWHKGCWGRWLCKKSKDSSYLWGDRGREEKRKSLSSCLRRRKSTAMAPQMGRRWQQGKQGPARKAPCNTRLLLFPFAKSVHLFQYLIFNQTLLKKKKTQDPAYRHIISLDDFECFLTKCHFSWVFYCFYNHEYGWNDRAGTNNCVFLFTVPYFSYNICNSFGSKVCRFSIREIYFVLGNFYLCVMDVKTLQRARLWKCWAQQVMFQEKKFGRNVSHGFALPGRQGKILPQGETKKSLIFVCHIVRTNLSRGWQVWIHLWLFHMKITVLIRKRGRRKMGQLLDN